MTSTLITQYSWDEHKLGSMKYLTQLPGKAQLQAVEQLLNALYPKSGEKLRGKSSSLKKLGVVLKAWHGMLIEELPEKDLIPQDGPFCFASVLERWQRMLKAAGVEPQAFLTRLFDVGTGEPPPNLLRIRAGVPMPREMGEKLFAVLVDVRDSIPTRGTVRELKRLKFGADERYLQALSEFLQGLEPPEGTNGDVQRELFRLDLLKQYWYLLEERLRGYFLSQIMLSLLAATLGIRPVKDFSPANSGPVAVAQLVLCTTLTGGSLCPALGRKLREFEVPHPLFMLPDLNWEEKRWDLLLRDRVLREQIVHLSGEAFHVLNVPAREDTPRTKAAAWLLLAMQQGVYSQTMTREQTLAVAENLLTCYGVFQDVDRGNIRQTLGELQNPEFAALKQAAETYCWHDLDAVVGDILHNNRKYRAFLDFCAQLPGWTPEQKRLLESEQEKLSHSVTGKRQLIHGQSLSRVSRQLVEPRKTPEEYAGRECVYRPVVSSLFDPVRRSGTEELQMHLASTVLTSQRLVLLGPQILDTGLVYLAGSQDFLQLLGSSALTFSAYGQNRTLLDYARNTFSPRNNGFVFSNNKLFQHEDAEYRAYLRRVTHQYLCAQSGQERKRIAGRIPAEAYADVLNYAQAVLLFDEALCAQRLPDGTVLSDRFHQRTGWLNTSTDGVDLPGEIGEHISALDNEREYELAQLHERVCSLLPGLTHGAPVGRSHIYTAAEQLRGDWNELIDPYIFITDLRYFSSITTKVTPFRCHSVEPDNFSLLPAQAREHHTETFSIRPVPPCPALITMHDLAQFARDAAQEAAVDADCTPMQLLESSFHGKVTLTQSGNSTNVTMKVEDILTARTTVQQLKSEEDGECGMWKEHAL